MRTLQPWVYEYAVSHQNKTTITIHYNCDLAVLQHIKWQEMIQKMFG